MTRREQAYNRRLKELIKKTDRLADREVEKVLGFLEQARSEVAARVASTEWQAHYIPELKEAVERAIEAFRQRYSAGQKEGLANIWNAGIDSIDAPLQYAGIRSGAPEISRTVLEVMQGYSADLINGLSSDAVKKINSELVLGVMGGKTPYETMKAIGRSLDEKSVFKSLGHRAEAITRTEMARVNSAAREARMQATAEAGTEPAMKWQKKWIASGKAHPRENHAALDGKIVDVNEDFPGGIPYPHAPGLPAKEVVQCG